MATLTPAGKAALFLVVAGGAFGAWRVMQQRGTPGGTGGETTVSGTASGTGSGTGTSLPAGDSCKAGTPVRFLGYAWNAHMGLHYANGGVSSAADSFMCKRGVNLTYGRQDMNDKLTEALVAFATALERGEKNPTAGAHFVTVMGDGSAAFLKGLDDALQKIGPAYRPKVVATIGYSRGEDKFMGPAAWKADPKLAKGSVIAGVIRDGDWNIALKWAQDNGLRSNPDEKTYDPDALNWVNTSDYLDAGEKYITGYSEFRPVVRNGKPTGERKKVAVQGVVTWTPGDVNVAQKKGGLVSIVSTKEYASQMPCTVIGIDKWCKDNRQTVENMLQAIYEGGAAVMKSDAALQEGAQISATVYKEQDAAYWARYFKGVVEKDKTGLSVELGGSSANTLSDAARTFGLIPGKANSFAEVYQQFGDIVVSQYPKVVPEYPPVEQVLDTSYVNDLVKKVGLPTILSTPKATPRPPSMPPSKPQQISGRAYDIPFATGRAEFQSNASKVLNSLKRDVLVASNTNIEIHGHTDNVGDPAKNMQLSEARAFAVKTWLEKQAPVDFSGRIKVYSHGQTQPAKPNTTEAGRAANRRVEVKLITR
ncbi:MAG: OmpA family protein [Armatimonas sp.]